MLEEMQGPTFFEHENELFDTLSRAMRRQQTTDIWFSFYMQIISGYFNSALSAYNKIAQVRSAGEEKSGSGTISGMR
ncbi:MAG: hypothetical protein P4M11_10670 [Candidatus Pacebacteria bacterium]|nr:hypothetical protein [Candidatus Paceibacterota bacterium]